MASAPTVLALRRDLSCCRKKHVEISAKSVSETLKNFQRWISSAPLYATHVCPIQTRSIREVLLRQADQFAVAAYGSAKMPAQVHRRHG